MDLLKKWMPKPPPELPPVVTVDDAGDSEPTELEVQQMLEAQDTADALAAATPIRPVKIIDTGYQIGETPAAAGAHALDLVAVNSKVVVCESDGEKFAVLATPNGPIRLPKGDPAHRLPVGARIVKTAQGQYTATQLSPTLDRPPLVTETALEAITGFIAHFHEESVTA